MIPAARVGGERDLKLVAPTGVDRLQTQIVEDVLRREPVEVDGEEVLELERHERMRREATATVSEFRVDVEDVDVELKTRDAIAALAGTRNRDGRRAHATPSSTR